MDRGNATEKRRDDTEHDRHDRLRRHRLLRRGRHVHRVQHRTVRQGDDELTRRIRGYGGDAAPLFAVITVLTVRASLAVLTVRARLSFGAVLTGDLA